MARSCAVMDEMVRDYLLFRGFTKTAQTLESEIKFDKDKNMRADKITEHLLAFAHGFDLSGLKDYWAYLNKRFFRKIPNSAIHKTLIKLEDCLYKYYIVNAHQSQKPDRVVEFFEKCSNDILGGGHRETWRDWFCFPYVKNPELSPVFGPYFQRIWSETVQMSLQNLISTVLDAVPLPTLLQWKESSIDVMEEKEQLQREVSVLKMKLQDNTVEDGTNANKLLVTRSDIDIAEDFYIVSKSPLSNLQVTTTGRSLDVGRSTVPDRANLQVPNSHKFTTLNSKEYKEHISPLKFARFSCGGMFCATSDVSGTLKVWTFSPEIKTLHSFVFKSGIFSLHWARKVDKLLYVGTGASKIKLVNISNRKISHELCHPTLGLRVLALASNLMCTNLVSSAAPPMTSTAHQVPSAAPPMTTPEQELGGEVVVWDCKSRELLHVLDVSPLPSPLTSLFFNHNGNLLVCGAIDGMIRVFADFQCIMGWQAHTTAIHTVKFSVDENTVFSFSRDGTLSQWRLYPMSQCLHSIVVSRDQTAAAEVVTDRDFALDAEGKFLLAARGNEAVIYSVESGFVEDSVLPSQGSKVTCVDWHVPYSTRLCLIATTSGTARINSLIY